MAASPASPPREALRSARTAPAPTQAPRATVRADTEPTVTDARWCWVTCLSTLLGGEMRIDPELARAAILRQGC